MENFLVEVIQPADVAACRRVHHALSALGSHFVARADWRRRGNEMIGTLAIDSADAAEALAIVPPPLRRFARITRLQHAEAA